MVEDAYKLKVVENHINDLLGLIRIAAIVHDNRLIARGFEIIHYRLSSLLSFDDNLTLFGMSKYISFCLSNSQSRGGIYLGKTTLEDDHIVVRLNTVAFKEVFFTVAKYDFTIAEWDNIWNKLRQGE